jgi:hypothetical protein
MQAVMLVTLRETATSTFLTEPMPVRRSRLQFGHASESTGTSP